MYAFPNDTKANESKILGNVYSTILIRKFNQRIVRMMITIIHLE